MKYRVGSLRKAINWGIFMYALRGFFASLFIVTCAVGLFCAVMAAWSIWKWSPPDPLIVNGQPQGAPPERPTLSVAMEVIYLGVWFGAIFGAIAGVGVAALRYYRSY